MNTEEHRKGLIKLYKNQYSEASPFMKAVLDVALYRLHNNSNPVKVEIFVVNVEKEYRK